MGGSERTTGRSLAGKTVLVTGGTGSFGRKLTTRLLSMKESPRKIIIFSRDEFKQYEMARDFDNDPRLRFFLGDVRDHSRLKRSFSGPARAPGYPPGHQSRL